MTKKQNNKWMVVQPIEIKHPTINVANKLVEILLRICICELISTTSHLDAHPDAHSDQMFLNTIEFWAIFSGKQR